MSEKDPMTQVYERAAAEQERYKEWLYSLPAKEALEHAFEYTAREDILMELEELELEPAKARTLLSSYRPLEDIYHDFCNLESSRMDEIRSCIEDRAGKLLERQRTLPLYKNTGEYARDHGELEQYRASGKANIACKEAIDAAIQEYFHDDRLESRRGVQEVIEMFGPERMFYVLAVTVQDKDWDERISRDNKEWAKTVKVISNKDGLGFDRNTAFVLESHPGLIDLFVKEARHEELLSRPLEPKEIEQEAARILSQLQALKEPNSPSGTHFSVKVSPDFMLRAGNKDTEKLAALLPFQSLTFSNRKDERGVYATISKDEDRFQPLRRGRASVRSKLRQQPSGEKPAPAKRKKKEPER